MWLTTIPGPRQSAHPSGLVYDQCNFMYAIGRLGQLIGLSLPAMAILLELNRTISLGQMLMLLVFSICVFWIGRILEGYAKG